MAGGLAANAELFNSINAAFTELYTEVPCMSLMLRYAWHDAGTYCKETNTGGPNASIRFGPEDGHPANAGLDNAKPKIDAMKEKFPDVSYADLIQAGGYAAIEFTGGPALPFRFGRVDAVAEKCTPDGRLPDANLGCPHLRDIFYRMGFNEKEITILSGAHAIGSAHADRSGFDGPWTAEPKKFDNSYFTELLNPSGGKLRLPTDEALLTEPAFSEWVNKYAEDQALFFADFTEAMVKLSELGCA